MKLPILIVGVLMSTNVLIAQTLDYKKASTTEGSNYEEIVKQQRQKFERQNRERLNLSTKKQRKQFERWAYFWKDRVNSDGTFPHSLEGWYNAGIIDENGNLLKNQARISTSLTEKWTNVGPQTLPEKNEYPNYPQMGRLNTFLQYKHATDETKNVYLVGAPSGGIWKSVDAGKTWSPKLDQLAGIGITDIKSTSTDIDKPGIIYVSTGDWDANDVNSLGIYKSTDAGETYTPTKLTFSLDQKETTSNLIVLNDTTVIVGTTDHVKKTTDGGETWTNILSSGDIGYEDLIFGRLVQHNDNIVCSDSYGGVYLSTDKGDSWGILVNVTGSTDKTAVTVDKSTGIFYYQNSAGDLNSYDPANSVTASLGKVPNYDSQGGYNQTLIVKDGLIISGSVNALTSSDNGTTWYNSLNGYWEDNSSDGNYIHSDHHAMGELGTGFNLYSCNDGGLSFVEYSSKTDKKPTVNYISSRVLVTQIYTVAITPQNADYFVIGNQDNDGYSKEMHNGKLTWVAAAAGDGTATAIDYSNSNIRYLGSQEGGLIRTDSSFSGHAQGTHEITTPKGAGFVWPLKLHSTVPTTLFGGFGDIYKSTDKGDNWTNLNSSVGQVSAIETFGDNIFAIGEDSARKTTDGGTTWTTLAQPYSKQDINSITFNQKDAMIVYATIPSYVDGEKAYKSTDGGKTWTNISKGLPNIISKKITLFQNQTDEILFLGTELGIYYKKNQDDWVRLGGDDMPNVIVNDLDINYTANTLVAATYGRGLWQRSLNDFTGTTNTKELITSSNYPIVKTNPITNGQVTVIVNDDKNYQYDLYNVVGGIISQGTLSNQHATIDVNTATNGIYILRTVGEDGNVQTQKIIIKN